MLGQFPEIGRIFEGCFRRKLVSRFPQLLLRSRPFRKTGAGGRKNRISKKRVYPLVDPDRNSWVFVREHARGRWIVVRRKGRAHRQAPSALRILGWQKRYEYSKYWNTKKFDVHILGTSAVSDEKMRQVAEFVDNMISALKSPQDRARFAGHQICLIGSEDPSLGEAGNIPNQRNGARKDVTLLDVDLINHVAADSRGNRFFRGWNIAAHEFGHSIEFKLGLQERSDRVFSSNSGNYDPNLKREYFAWATEKWFNSSRSKVTRDKIAKWEYDYLATVYDAENEWVPAVGSAAKP